jgi:hypothetical protein
MSFFHVIFVDCGYLGCTLNFHEMVDGNSYTILPSRLMALLNVLIFVAFASLVYQSSGQSVYQLWTIPWTEGTNDGARSYGAVATLYRDHTDFSESGLSAMELKVQQASGCGDDMSTPMCSCLDVAHAQLKPGIDVDKHANEVVQSCFVGARAWQGLRVKQYVNEQYAVNVPTLVLFWNFIGLVGSIGRSGQWSQGAIGGRVLAIGTCVVAFVMTIVALAFDYHNWGHFTLIMIGMLVYCSLASIHWVSDWSFSHDTILFWPLYAVGLCTVCVVGNLYGQNRDYSFNVACLLMVNAVACALLAGDYAHEAMSSDQRKQDKPLNAMIRNSWRCATLLLVVMYTICESEWQPGLLVELNSVFSVVHWAFKSLVFIAVLQHSSLRTGTQDSSIVVARRTGLELVARILITVAVMVDMVNMSNEDNLRQQI